MLFLFSQASALALKPQVNRQDQETGKFVQTDPNLKRPVDYGKEGKRAPLFDKIQDTDLYTVKRWCRIDKAELNTTHMVGVIDDTDLQTCSLIVVDMKRVKLDPCKAPSGNTHQAEL